MTPHTFRGYGVNSTDVSVILERITHWFHIDYNGNMGTEIVLDTGKSVRVGHYHDEVATVIKQASAERRSPDSGKP